MATKKTVNKEMMHKPNKKKLNRWYLFLTCFLNLLQSNTVAMLSFIFIILVSFGVGYCAKYPTIRSILALEHQIKVEDEMREQKEIEDTVLLVMRLYNCDSLTIFNTIMETFDPVYVSIVIGIESEYNPKAISPVGAKGLMQLMHWHIKPGKKWDDPVDNIKIGAVYLEDLLKQFNGDKQLALAAYNAGPNAVVKAGYKIPNTKNDETKNYVYKAQKLDNYLQGACGI